VLDVVLESSSLDDVCRRAVLSPASNNTFRGCHIHLLDKTGQLTPDAHFGQDLPDNFKSSAQEAIYSRNLIFTPETPTSAALVCIPLISENLPIAVAILVLRPGANRQYFSDRIVPLISKLVGHQLNLLKLSGRAQGIQTFSGAAHVSEISTRQVKILEFMAEGLTNAEIARKLLLSESTVRQESVRIYRIFNTDSRQAAVSAGREAGIIAKLEMAG
jgi:DNA-binding CsgD family transcriptional regulator